METEKDAKAGRYLMDVGLSRNASHSVERSTRESAEQRAMVAQNVACLSGVCTF